MFLQKFDTGSVHSNIKTNTTLLKLANENLVCSMCLQRRQHMRVRRPFNNTYVLC